MKNNSLEPVISVSNIFGYYDNADSRVDKSLQKYGFVASSKRVDPTITQINWWHVPALQVGAATQHRNVGRVSPGRRRAQHPAGPASR